jgi:hypothetical protein
MNKLKTLLIAIFAVAGSLAPVALVPAVSYAQGGDLQSGLCSGANLQAPGTEGDCENINEEASTGVNDTVKLIIDIFSWVVGVVSVIMIIWGGFKYITSGGDAGSVTAAKNTILYAIVGLIIVALAQIIVKFVLGNVTNQG